MLGLFLTMSMAIVVAMISYLIGEAVDQSRTEPECVDWGQTEEQLTCHLDEHGRCQSCEHSIVELESELRHLLDIEHRDQEAARLATCPVCVTSQCDGCDVEPIDDDLFDDDVPF